MKTWIKSAATLASLGMLAGGARAANLDGQSITVHLSGSAGYDYGSKTVVAGPGDDGNYFGVLFFDVNGGANGDTFTVSSTESACGIDCDFGTITWSVSNLDLGAPISGINVIQDIAPVTADAITPTSVAFTYADASIPTGTFLQVQYLTGVPEPATWAMLTLGVGMIGFAARRRVGAPRRSA